MALIEITDLKKYFPIQSMFGAHGAVKAVDGVSFKVEEGETLGLVGESGCGKTTVSRCILRLIEPTAGRIVFDGTDITGIPQSQMRPLRKDMQIVFQDPYSSLDPRMTVGDIIFEPLTVHGSGADKHEVILDSMEKVGLKEEHMWRYPHEFSGGQRQRICIARALSTNPRFLIFDEPTSSLDVSVQAQILNLIHLLQKEMNLTYLFVSHHLSVIHHISDRVAVMYLGKIVEVAHTQEIFDHQRHPYTQALLSAIPTPNPKLKRKRIILHGDVPSPINPPTGCRFHPRCIYAKEKCAKEEPMLENGIACFYPL